MWFDLTTTFLIGLGLGLFYFGGLWWTVHCLEASGHPALLLMGSYIVRTVTVVFSFYLVMSGSWPRLLACLAGFLAIRTLLAAYLAFTTTMASSNTDRIRTA